MVSGRSVPSIYRPLRIEQHLHGEKDGTLRHCERGVERALRIGRGSIEIDGEAVIGDR